MQKSKYRFSYKLAETKLILDYRKAVYLPEYDCLLMADIHLGKVEHFRRSGIAVPSEAGLSNQKRMTQVMKDYNPSCLIILGDLFHSELNSSWLQWLRWIHAHPDCDIILIQGNHDIYKEELYIKNKITLQKQLIVGPFNLTHKPKKHTGYFNICGHIHPGVVMEGKGRQRLRLPCFYIKDNTMILPAFGNFTGLSTLVQKAADDLIVLAEDTFFKK